MLSFSPNAFHLLSSVFYHLFSLLALKQYGPRKYKLAVGSNMFTRKEDLKDLPRSQQDRIRFSLGEMKEVSFGHYQVGELSEITSMISFLLFLIDNWLI